MECAYAAEDTSNHEINYHWFYNTVSKKLTRLASVPYGAEVTGSYFLPNINGWSYMLMNVQHPYEGKEDKLCASCSFMKLSSVFAVVLVVFFATFGSSLRCFIIHLNVLTGKGCSKSSN